MTSSEENEPRQKRSRGSVDQDCCGEEEMDLEPSGTIPPATDKRFRISNLYDRQIRLWGWEAQQRLMTSRLLMYGMNGVGAEVLKNVMLGGIRQITILDNAIVHESDLSTNFFLRREDFGLNRASCSAKRARLLNSTCDLTALEGDAKLLTQELIQGFDLVALNGVQLDEARRVSKICRVLGIPFFLSQVVGFHAFYVNDLNGLKFEVPPMHSEKPVASKIPFKPFVDPNGPSTSRRVIEQAIICTEDDKPAVSQEPVQLVISSPDVATILTKESARRSGLASPTPKRMFGLKRIDPYLNMEMLLTFVDQHGRYPGYEHYQNDLKSLEDILTSIRLSGDTRIVQPSEMLSPDANFTCAIFGGTLAQEIITVLTRRGYPIYNMYYLAAMDAMGSREYLE